MRNVIRVGLLLSLALIPTTGQQSEEPSLNDTLVWIKDFIHDHPAFRVSDEFSSSGCQATVTETYVYTGFYPSGDQNACGDGLTQRSRPERHKVRTRFFRLNSRMTGGYVVTMTARTISRRFKSNSLMSKACQN